MTFFQCLRSCVEHNKGKTFNDGRNRTIGVKFSTIEAFSRAYLQTIYRLFFLEKHNQLEDLVRN